MYFFDQLSLSIVMYVKNNLAGQIIPFIPNFNKNHGILLETIVTDATQNERFERFIVSIFGTCTVIVLTTSKMCQIWICSKRFSFISQTNLFLNFKYIRSCVLIYHVGGTPGTTKNDIKLSKAIQIKEYYRDVEK